MRDNPLEMNPYRMRILESMRALIEPLGPLDSALDFGSGDGFFCSQWRAHGNVKQVTPVDVVERKTSLVKPTLYDGKKLPFADRSFALAYSVDVLHHCPDPLAALFDLARCTQKYLLIKDHTYETWLGKWTLAVLDELGNRRFGIPSLYLYQQGWSWVDALEAQGWRRMSLTHPMACHVGLLGAATNPLQFIGLWVRESA